MSDSASQVDPESVMPTPQPGELIASVLTLGPVPWFIKRRRPILLQENRRTLKDGSKCVCGAGCRCCGTRRAKTVESVDEKDRIKQERKESILQMKRDEEELIKQENWKVGWLKWYFYLGCFGLPFVHFVIVLYFLPELKAVHNSNFKIRRYCYLSLIVGLTESLLWAVWFVIFQVFEGPQNDVLEKWNILNASVNYSISSFV